MGCDDDDSHHRSQSPQLIHLSSPSPTSSTSSESSFRELEDAFLQTQTRIWLGEVLKIRLDENLIISEVLADGELLFQASKVVWRLLLAKHIELRHVIAYQHQPFASKKNSGRYRPYSNVDSFLKVCKILGLTGIDLFSPSDVVEKRNTRKVCMCIRSFSIKARSKNVNVPDFDVVSCTITMPKDMVGYIRRNLELSQNSLTDSPTYYSQKHEEAKHRQGYSDTASPGDHETYLEEEYDEATEINHEELQSEPKFEFLSSEKSLHPLSENIEKESGFMRFDYSDQVEASNLEENNTSNVHHSASSHGSNSTPESIEYDKGYFDICDNSEVLRNWSMEPVNLSNKFDAQDDFETLGSFEVHSDKVDQWDRITEGYKAEDAMEYGKMSYDEITSNAKYLHTAEKFEDSEDLLSFHSYLSFDFCKWDQKGKCALVSPKDHRSHKDFKVIPSEPKEDETAVKLDIVDKQTNKDCQVVLSDVVGIDHHEKCSSNEEEAHDHDIAERVLHVVTNEDVSHDPQSSDTCPPEERTPEDEKKTEESAEKPRGKSQNNIMLKSVLGGTAAVGMLVMFLHLRRSSGEKNPKSMKTSSSDAVKDKVQKNPSQKTQSKSKTEGVYPAEKLKLGD